MPRRHFPDTSKGGPGRQRAPVGEDLHKRNRIDFRFNISSGEQRLHLRTKQELLSRNRVVNGAYPEAVSRQQQLLLPRVPNGDGELPVQPQQALRAKLFVQVKNNLGICVGRKAMASRFQLRAKLRSEERRVGKECRSWWAMSAEKKK